MLLDASMEMRRTRVATSFLESILSSLRMIMCVAHDLHAHSAELLPDNQQDNASFYNGLYSSGIEAAPRMLINSSIFRGASFKTKGLGHDSTHASMISTMPAVKKLWPLRNYSIPELQHKNTMANPHGHIFTAEDDATTADNFSTHVMTQVNQVHAKGCKFIPEGVRHLFCRYHVRSSNAEKKHTATLKQSLWALY